MSVACADPGFVNLLAAELNSAIERSVECWLAEVNYALTNPALTTLGRLHAVESIVEQYKTLTGKTALNGRSRHDI
jgi:hypothetical protein